MKLLPSLLAALAAASTFAEPAVEEVIVRQQWPWSTDVRVDYVLTGVTSPVDVTVECFNGEEALAIANRNKSLRGELYGISKSDTYTFTIDPVKAFGAGRNLMDFRVRLTLSPSAENMSETLYRVFDLVGGKEEAPITRADILNGKYGSYETEFSAIGNGFNTTLEDVIIWTGVTNDVKYATTHLVMRKIPAKDVVWKIGSPSNELGHGYSNENNREKQYDVKLTQDFFIGVFPITQSQYTNGFFAASPSNPSAYKNREDAPFLPVENMKFFELRGCSVVNFNNDNRGASGEYINWPTNSYIHEVATASKLAALRSATGVEFDMPTAAQWEFACRGGTTNSLYSGKNISNTDTCSEIDEIAWYRSNSGGIPHPVGLKRPNAYGLYDMAGNIFEYCLDWYAHEYNANSDEEPLVDPVGIIVREGKDVNAVTKRGGSYDSWARYCRSGYRHSDYVVQNTNRYLGFRVVCPVGAKWSD